MFFAPMWKLARIEQRIKSHEETLDMLTRLVKSRDLDWEDMRARCKRLLDRTEKAARPVVQSETEAPSGEEPSANQGNGSSLTPHQIRMQQMILRQRGGH